MSFLYTLSYRLSNNAKATKLKGLNMNTSTTTTISTSSLMSQAHKAAGLAFAAQKADASGNLLYSDFVGYYMKQLAKPAPVVVATTVATKTVATKAVNIKETIAYSFVAVIMILVGMLPNIELVNALIEKGYLSSDLKMVGLVGASVMFNLLIVGIVKASDMLMNNKKEVA